MMTAKRTDAHSPTNMDPAQYEYVAAFDNQSKPGWVLMGGNWALEISRKIGRDDKMERGTHQCHHCGARIRYFAVMEYLPTGEYIVVGETCLDNRFSLQSKADFDRLRKAAELDRKKERIKTSARARIEELVTSRDLEWRTTFDRDTDLAQTYDLSGYGLDTITDIRSKLWHYGNVSDRAVDLVAKLIAEVPKRKAEQEVRDAEVKIPAPTGKVSFTGVVVSIKEYEYESYGYYGSTDIVWKLTVKVETTDGVYLVWVSRPILFSDVSKGDTVTMTATLTCSDKDESFAFGKRPSKAQIITRAKVDGPTSLD